MRVISRYNPVLSILCAVVGLASAGCPHKSVIQDFNTTTEDVKPEEAWNRDLIARFVHPAPAEGALAPGMVLDVNNAKILDLNDRSCAAGTVTMSQGPVALFRKQKTVTIEAKGAAHVIGVGLARSKGSGSSTASYTIDFGSARQHVVTAMQHRITPSCADDLKIQLQATPDGLRLVTDTIKVKGLKLLAEAEQDVEGSAAYQALFTAVHAKFSSAVKSAEGIVIQEEVPIGYRCAQIYDVSPSGTLITKPCAPARMDQWANSLF